MAISQAHRGPLRCAIDAVSPWAAESIHASWHASAFKIRGRADRPHEQVAYVPDPHPADTDEPRHGAGPDNHRRGFILGEHGEMLARYGQPA